MNVTDEMVDRFLSWRLPSDFAPDCGISFDGRKPDQWNTSREWPIGTNLFTAVQAKAMLEHVLGIPSATPATGQVIEAMEWALMCMEAEGWDDELHGGRLPISNGAHAVVKLRDGIAALKDAAPQGQGRDASALPGRPVAQDAHAPAAAASGIPSPATVTTHTDHPLRHFDRTCPACVADEAGRMKKAGTANESDRVTATRNTPSNASALAEAREEQLGDAIGIEIHEPYFDIACERSWWRRLIGWCKG